jgi:hypothetical protein
LRKHRHATEQESDCVSGQHPQVTHGSFPSFFAYTSEETIRPL